MSKLKPLKKALPTAVQLVTGDNVRYVPGLNEGDYGVVKPYSTYALGDEIYGIVLDCYKQERLFCMPSAVFSQLPTKTA